MRALVVLAALLLAGCAGSGPAATTTPGSPASQEATPSAASPTPTPTPAPTLQLGVVLDVTHDFARDAPANRTFNVTGGEHNVTIFVETSGPASDGRFSNSVVDFYFPTTTSPFLTELPAQQAHNYTVVQQPLQGTWRVVFDGGGPTSAHVRVTLQ